MEKLTLLAASLTGVATVVNLIVWATEENVASLVVAIVTFAFFLQNLSVIF